MRFVIFICLLPFFTLAQPVSRDSTQNFWHEDEVWGAVYGSINLNTGDTTTHYGGRRIIKAKDGAILSEGRMLGGMGSACGCVSKPNGYWIYRYRSGQLKSQGTLECGQKEGTWVNYFENGNISKVETFAKPYSIFTSDSGWDGPNNRHLYNGDYLEYFANGQLKISGKFELFEFFSTLDTVYSLNVETYEVIYELIKGEFWLPQSVKIGWWLEFDAQGVLLKKEYFKKPEKARLINRRYWDWLEEIFRPDSTGIKVLQDND